MRIAIDARYVADRFPGIGRYVFSLVQALAALDHEHELVVLHNPALRNTRFDIAALAMFPRVRLVETAARPFSPAEQLLVPRVLRAVRADLYHAPYYVMPYAGLPCPAVVTLYDAIPRLFPAEVSPRARLLFDLLMRLAIRSANTLLTISASARADLAAAFGLAPEKILVTPLAADERFRPQPPATIAAVRKRYALPERYVLCVSSNKPHKNLPALLAAWELVRTERIAAGSQAPLLVLAGHEDPRYPEARDQAMRRSLTHAVRFLPDISDVALPALYSGAELFVYPSRYEGFGLPPLEALACGAPVVCGRSSSLPEVVGDAALTVDVTCPEALAAAIQRVLATPAFREQLREQGLARAQHFSWRRTAELTLAAYERYKAKG
jgi:glycosyltransferase involved in cell wall biosynthesis